MIAAVALCGAVAGFAALYLALRYAMQGDGRPQVRREPLLRRWRLRIRSRAAAAAATLPRARIYRRNGERDASSAPRRLPGRA
jgi:uncharacterized membrane protein YdjX (TVP38/TMEM64 family)